jgi:RNA polymerase sigma-70 factor (ECF subfamily)
MATLTIERHDDDLGRRFQAGDDDAFREVCERYSAALRRLSRSLLADPEHARDAVQQTLLQAWRASGRFDPDRPLAAWLFQICRRVCIDRYRQEGRAAQALTPTGSVADRATTEGPSLERAWTVWEVRRAVAELPRAERTVVQLHYLEGWSHGRIAEHLGIPVGTVQSRSFYARRRLADALAHLRGPEPDLDRQAA